MMSQNNKRWFRQQDPDPEVTPKAKRRQFSAAYKKRILEEYDACTELGEKGALLRKEGIYSSYITTWKRQQRSGVLDGLEAKKRGPRTDPKEEKISRLEKENERLRERLEQAELIIEVQLPRVRTAKKSLRYLDLPRPRTARRIDGRSRRVVKENRGLCSMYSVRDSKMFLLPGSSTNPNETSHPISAGIERKRKRRRPGRA